MVRAWIVWMLVPTGALAAAAPEFDPERATPYFASGAGAAAMKRFRVEDWAGAAKLFQRFLDEAPRAERDKEGNQARFLAAYALSKAGRFLEAARAFDELAKSYPLLADYHHLYAARAYLAGKELELSLKRARLVPPTSPLDGEARFARADALRVMKLHAEAEGEYRGYLEHYSKSWREPEARFRLAEALDTRTAATGAGTRPDVDRGFAEARSLYREVYIRFPTESWARLAEARLRAASPPALELSGAERITRAMAFFDAMRNPESEAEFRAALTGPGLTPVEQCLAGYHLAQSVFKQRDRPRAAALFDQAAALCEKAPKGEAAAADLHAKSLYQGARCHAARGDLAQAAACFARVEAEHPAHSYADDARLRGAETYAALAEQEHAALIGAAPVGASPAAATGRDGGAPIDYDRRAEELLADLADRYPKGDQGGEAYFRLALRAWQHGQLDAARRWLETEAKRYPREEGWWEAGRTLYWIGRVADRQGRPDEARDKFVRCAKEYPLSYYALAALNRLRERWPEAERTLVEELRQPEPSAADSTWHFADKPVFREPGFLRGVELARLGLGAEAKREFTSVGIKVAEGKGAKIADAAAEELLWLAAVLLDRAGEYALSHSIPRHLLTDYQRRWPVGDNRKRWLLAYPRGYADLIVEHAGKNGQPAALEFAIVREESAFDPLMESFANAVGLTQLTSAPAKRFAQGLPYSREALRDPAINVAIGARELGDLWKRTGGSAPLAIAGYNAGEGAVRRWLRAATASEGLDEFIEAIPYDETRGYTKRVLSSFFAYHWLYDGGDPVPSLPLPLRKP